MAAAPTLQQMVSPTRGGSNTNVSYTAPAGVQAAPSSPLNSEPVVGGSMSVTPGQIVFTEFQARVFNQTEAVYKTTGFLGTSLFEDSYLLQKATATWILGNVPTAGPISTINTQATRTYRGVLGIADPTPPPPPPPDLQTTSDPVSTNTGFVDSNGDSVSPVNPVRGGGTISPIPSTTPTAFTPPTSVAPVSEVGLNANNVPTTLVMENEAASTPRNNFNSPLGGSSGPSTSGGKIICNELYRQGFLSEEMWNADEKYGEMMFEKDPKLVIGYQMWARKVVKFMKENPNNTKMAYWLFKPWTEYMGYKMGVVEKPTLRGRFTNWIGSQLSYMVFNLYNGKRLLDKYNYKVFRQENNIPNYKMA